MGDVKSQTIAQIDALSIQEEPINLGEAIEGKKCIIIVNVASKCALAKHSYRELVQVYKKY